MIVANSSGQERNPCQAACEEPPPHRLGARWMAVVPLSAAGVALGGRLPRCTGLRDRQQLVCATAGVESVRRYFATNREMGVPVVPAVAHTTANGQELKACSANLTSF